MTTISRVFVGIDVSKKYLDVYIHPAAKLLRIENSEDGVATLHNILTNYQVEIVGFESSGGYEYLAKQALEKASYITWVIQPKRVKAYIYSEGIHYKTDASDAKMIALFIAQKNYKPATCFQSDAAFELRSLVTRRDDLMAILGMEKNRLGSPMQIYCRNSISKHIAFIKKEIVVLEHEINAAVEKDEAWKHKVQLLESIPGIGRVTATTLLTNVPELGNIAGKKIAALIGVAPFVKQSGTYKGKSVVTGGRVVPRKVLYMATLVATRYNANIETFYKRLVESGKPKKVALVASMRKLIVIANAMLKNDEMWHGEIA